MRNGIQLFNWAQNVNLDILQNIPISIKDKNALGNFIAIRYSFSENFVKFLMKSRYKKDIISIFLLQYLNIYVTFCFFLEKLQISTSEKA